MAFVVKDRVKETTTTTGTSDLVLSGSVSGFQSFSNALADGDTTYYALFEVSTNEWEVGVGTWTESTTTLARTTVLASSNSGSKVSLTAQAEVFISQPAGKAAFFNPDGDLDLNRDPQSALQAATKQYVDTIAAAGLHYHDPVRVEQEGNLSATYDNGTAGVGATLTNNSTQAALTIDGVALSLNDRVLIYEQTNGYENGVYTVTNVGSASTNWVLTRATDADSYGPSDPDSLGQGDAFFVLEGAAGAGELYVMNTEGTITFGTTNITFTQVAATAVYTAGTGLTLTGTEFAASQDISTTASPSFAGITVGDGHTIGDDIDDNLTFTSSSGENIAYNSAAGTHAFKSNGTSTVTFDSSGNITVTGTVDGRDIAADGSKLDGIESGATADQTKADIDALGINAATLDSLDSTQFLRSDANDSTSGILTSTSNDTGSGGITVDSPLSAYISSDRGGTGYQAGYMWRTAGSTDWYNYISTSSAELKWYTTSNVMTLTTSGSLSTAPQGTLWGSSNDGSGSGLDADTVDGIEASSFLRSDADDTTSGVITFTHTGTSPKLFLSGNGGASSYNYIIKGSNDAGTGAVHFINGSTRTTDGGASTYTIRNDIGPLRLGRTSQSTLIEGSGDLTYNGNEVWHSGNDGSGSGLDADTTDGYQADESSTGSTLAARNSSGDLYMRYGVSSYMNMTHSSTTRSSDTVFYSSTDNYIRKNNATGFKNSLGLGTGDGPTFSSVTVADALYHSGDGDTYVSFGNDLMALATGGVNRVYLSSSGVQLGDTGNGYFQPVSGSYGSIQIDGGAHNGWEGYSIGGRAVFMHDNASRMGLYDDVNNEWGFIYDFNSAAQIFYNGSSKLQTTNTGVNIYGDLNAVDNIYVAGNIYHEGDTNTYVSFGPDAIYLVSGGNTNFSLGSGYTNINQPLYNYAVYYEDYDALSGTSVTVNCDTAQAFALSMTGNTTFTFNSPSSGWATGFVLELTGNGGTVTWPTSVKWAGGTAPDAPASGETDIYVFYTKDGGTNWYGVLSVDAAA